MEILWGLITGLFWPVLIVVGIVWLVKKFSSTPTSEYVARDQAISYTPTVSVDESSIRRKIAEEIRAQIDQYKTPTQKKVVEDMAQTVEYFASHGYEVTSVEQEQNPEMAYDFAPAGTVMSSHTAVSASSTAQPEVSISSDQSYETPWKKLQLLDGATILLYLGAFFVLASIGLYVGLGQGDELKAILVTLITALFYGAGIALFKNSIRLKPAGLTFVAIGMATLPMAGAAMYYFAFNEQHGPLIWLLTSAIAIGLYAHAMYVLRSALVSYMVVFSTVSVVLAGISSLGIAPYYFIQGIGFAGLAFAIGSKIFGTKDNELTDAYDKSAMFMVPFSTSLAVLFAARIGWLQLAFSMLLGATYYAYAAMQSSKTRSLYVLLAQVMGIASFITAGYGISEQAVVVASLSGLVGVIYILTWLLWARIRISTDVYRQQVKFLTLGLPLVAVTALLGSADILWIAFTLVLLASVVIYVYDRDRLSGLGWLFSVLLLPLLVCYFALEVTPSTSTVGISYLAIGALSVLMKYTLGDKSVVIDKVFQQSLLYVSLTMASLMQFGTANETQAVIMALVVALLTVQALLGTEKKYFLTIPALVQLVWVAAFVDDVRYLFWTVVGIAVYNLVLAQAKISSSLHAWLVLGSLVLLPLIWGLGVVTPDWEIKWFWLSYTGLFATLLLFRYIRKVLVSYVSITGYVMTLCVSIVLSFYVDIWFGFGVAIIASLVLIGLERLEASTIFGYFSPLLPLGLLLHTERTAKQALVSLVTAMIVAKLITLWRRRRYEAYIAVTLSVISLWFAGSFVYDWSEPAMMWLFMGMSLGYIVLRLALKNKVKSFSDVLMSGYSVSLGMSLIYCLTTQWETMSSGLFAIGLLLTAISYLESAPPVVIGSFLAGYGSILRYADGNNLSLNATVGLVLGLSQGVYWLLVISKLDTLRAKYARYFQLTVGAIVPLIGLGYFERPIFPASLTLFSLMLTREIWSKGQSAKESALFMVHLSGLWWLYALGVREVQIFTQSTALVIAGFAYWRRKIQDSPSVINQYLWIAVLTFTLPMVYQALASSDPKYSYLLLVEHVLLIVMSITLKRATFAWWGIAVTVAAVLYQLRKLRYVALAFLGAFIISLAVYFLLRYNKPEEPKK